MLSYNKGGEKLMYDDVIYTSKAKRLMIFLLKITGISFAVKLKNILVNKKMEYYDDPF